jgi:ferredoxin
MSNKTNANHQLCHIVDVDKDKCLNCHVCITVCPVKYCNDGSGDYVKVNNNLCIGCGSCLKICTHDARVGLDDFQDFLNQLENNTPTIAIVAPSIASNFPDQYLELNGWLKSLGVTTFFDVSFGAELCVKSYVEYIKSNATKAN